MICTEGYFHHTPQKCCLLIQKTAKIMIDRLRKALRLHVVITRYRMLFMMWFPKEISDKSYLIDKQLWVLLGQVTSLS
jgi:hypothetical protein